MAVVAFLPPIRGVLRGIESGQALKGFSEYMNNCRPISTLNNKILVCQRPGMDKWGNGDQIGAAEQPVVEMTLVSSVV